MSKNFFKRLIINKLRGGVKLSLKNARFETKQINLQYENERIAIAANYRAELNAENERYAAELASIKEDSRNEMINLKCEYISQRTAIENRLRELGKQRYIEQVEAGNDEALRAVVEKFSKLRSEQINLIGCLSISYDKQRNAVYDKKTTARAEAEKRHKDSLEMLLSDRNCKIATAKKKRESLIDDVVRRYGNAEG